MVKKLVSLSLAIPLSFFIASTFFSDARAGDAMKISVSLVPQKYFVERIGGDRVQVSVMVSPGANPATYEPKPQQMIQLTKSKGYFAIGVPFEKVWLSKFQSANPKMALIHTDEDIKKIPMETAHSHHDTPHQDKMMDPHVWLSPPLVVLQARKILDTLSRIDPSNKGTYEKNYKKFINDIVDLDLNLFDVFIQQIEKPHFMVYHPAWGYFAKAYGLKQIPIEIEGKEPTPKEMEAFVHQANKLNIKVIFVQPQFSTKSAKTVADAVGAQIMFADPLAMDWTKNLLNIAETFKTVLR
ncbi:MAG: zinc ABC transporter substrate-binding protein [Pseudomonadota bacterium]